MKETQSAIINFGGVLVAAFVGTFVANQGQRDLWKAEKLFSIQSGYVDKRIETIKTLVEVFATGQRLAYVNNLGTSNSGASMLSQMLYCRDVEHRRDNNVCEAVKPDAATLAQFAEIEAATARFTSAATMAKIYFCGRTKDAFKELPQGAYWWNVSDAKRAELFETMDSELFCDISFADVKLKGM